MFWKRVFCIEKEANTHFKRKIQLLKENIPKKLKRVGFVKPFVSSSGDQPIDEVRDHDHSIKNTEPRLTKYVVSTANKSDQTLLLTFFP